MRKHTIGLMALATCLVGQGLRSPAVAEDKSVRVAGIVLKWIRGDKEANYRRAEPMIREAAKNGAKIVCTTECFLDGYAIADKSIPLATYRALGEPIPEGKYFRRLSKLAAELDIHLLAGMLEADGEHRYNTAVLIGPDGKLLGRYHKQKLGHESVRNTAGKESSVFKLPFATAGVMICADRRYPQVVKRFVNNGADFLLCPSGGMFGPKRNDPIVQDRSRENKKYVIFVHPAEFLVTAPDGSIVSRTIIGDRLLIADEDVGKPVDKNRVFYFDLPIGKAAAAAEKTTAELILRGGKVATMDPKHPRAEAVAVDGKRILAVGSNETVSRLAGETTKVIDLNGKLVVPGFIESHGHMLGIGRAKLELNLVGTKSEAEIAELVRRRAAKAKPREWIVGRGWDQNDWPAKQFPDHQSLTAAAPDNPVLLTRIDGHAAWANRPAMEIAGLTKDSPEVSGGRIHRDKNGRPTGVLIDRAIGLVSKHVPSPTREQNKRAMQAAIQECLALGVTSFHDAGCGRETISLYRELLAEGKLPVRVYVMLRGSDEGLLAEHFRRGPQIGLGEEHLTIRSIKLIADGALGSRGAALLEPYDDAPDHRGLLILPEKQVFRIADAALRHGFQVATHAIGDRANRVVLDAYERAFAAHPDVKDPRFRIEHAQILDAADIPRFAKLGVIASMQATHCTSDMPWVPDRLGTARAKEGAYVWQKLLRSGARIANGSDAPVESLNPLRGFFAAVTRCDHRGKPPGGWYPDQRMTREQALRSFTLEGAYAAFEEDIKGSLAQGKLADLVVVSHDILTVPEPRLLSAEVVMTIVGGEVVYRRPASR